MRKEVINLVKREYLQPGITVVGVQVEQPMLTSTGKEESDSYTLGIIDEYHELESVDANSNTSGHTDVTSNGSSYVWNVFTVGTN